MDARSAMATLFGPLFCVGAAAMIGATALPARSPYYDVMMYGGGFMLFVGACGLVYLLASARRSEPVGEQGGTSAEQPAIRIGKAGSVHIEGNTTRSSELYSGDSVKSLIALNNKIGGHEHDEAQD
jgi:hypothetical protein